MDEALSRWVPTYKIGNDGLSWWVGQIEETASNTKGKGGWRYKVAIVGAVSYTHLTLPTNREV